MKLPIQPKCGIPIYLQLAESICYEIRGGNLSMGDPLPPTRRLAAENGLDHKTVARAYAELRSQGVAFPSRPTGPYIIMSQARHIAETQRGHALKIMSAILCAARILRRMPPELETHKNIQDCLDKFNQWDAHLHQLQQTIDSERSKPAHDLPGIISPIGIDEALAAMAALGAPNPSSAREANPLAQKEASEDTPWNNSHFSDSISSAPNLGLQDPDSQNGAAVPGCDPGHLCPTPDTPWNNSTKINGASRTFGKTYRLCIQKEFNKQNAPDTLQIRPLGLLESTQHTQHERYPPCPLAGKG